MSRINNSDWLAYTIIIAAIVIVFSSMFGIKWFQASQEAKAFNRFSEIKITAWDALWADYRILPSQIKE